jgi:peroxiredoxin
MAESRRTEDLLDRPLPDLELLDSEGGAYCLRKFVGRSPVAFFFYIHGGTPG